MKRFISITATIVLLQITVSCNKNKTVANRLDGDKWEVAELSVDGVNESVLPVLKFQECDIYEESCSGTWYYGESGHAEFAWQVREKGKTIQIVNQADHVHGAEDVKAAEQCIRFTGTYEVLERKRTEMKFKTNSAHGHPGKTVLISLKKK